MHLLTVTGQSHGSHVTDPDLCLLIAVNVTVLGTDYSLYTYVHHSYGLNDAFDRSVAHLLSTQQPGQIDSETDSLLQDSVQSKPLDQDDTAITAVDPAEGRRRSMLQGIDLVSGSSPNVGRERARSRSILQGRITVEHPCLHEGYSQEYAWVAHGAHVAPLPQVQLLGR